MALVTRQIPQGGLPGSAARLPSADDVPAQLAALEVILDADRALRRHARRVSREPP